MSEPLWRKVSEVAVDLVAAAVVLATTVLIEKLVRTVGTWSSDNDFESEGKT